MSLRSGTRCPLVGPRRPDRDEKRLAEISPTRRVPSHGTDLFATTYAFDFVAVDDDGLTAPARSLRALFTPEPPELFHAFGRPLYSPVAGTVVSVHDGEPDHVKQQLSHLADAPNRCREMS